MAVPASERIQPLGNRFRDLAMIVRRIRLEERSGARRTARAWARLGRIQAHRQELSQLEAMFDGHYRKLTPGGECP